MHGAIAHAGSTFLTSTEMRRHLGELADRVIAVLLSEPFERRKARAIGSALANNTHYPSPDTLGSAQEELARQLGEDLSGDEVVALQPRLAVLLSEIAAGFLEQARETILLEQEQIKAELLSKHGQAEEDLRKSEANLAEVQRIARLGHWDYDQTQDRLRWSDEVCRIFGVARQELGKTFEDHLKRVHPEDRELLEEACEEASVERTLSLEHRIVRPDGEVRTVQHRLQVVFDDAQVPLGDYAGGPDEGDDESNKLLNHFLRMASQRPGQVVGRPVRVVGTIQDITERKALEERLKYQAFHDPLTGLPNRALFLARLGEVLAQSNRPEGRVQVLFLDLDNFKLINDSLGHTTGDQLLLKVATRLKSCLRSQGTVARFGGDEFAILLQDAVMGVSGAIHAAEQIIKELRAPFFLEGHEVFVTPSIGIASSTFEQDTPENLLHNADTAMYWAKTAGKANYEVFEPGMNVGVLERLKLINDLRWAIEREEFVIHYQPIMKLAPSKGIVAPSEVIGVEALLRWEHPERGLVPAAEFIPLAEETGLIVPIGQWVIEEVCRRTRLWQQQYFRDSPLMVSVNLSAWQLQYPRLTHEITRALRESRADLNALQLEITESAVVKDEEVVFEKLEELKGLGVRLAIDDFGTGYSSLSQLNRLPIDSLKIDKSFVERLGKDPKAESIIRATIMLSQALELEVVAEGVETIEQLSQLRRLGCNLAQGNYFAKPLTSEEASALIATETVLY